MNFSEEQLRAAHKHAFGNRPEIRASKLCGCFSCFATFPPSDVWEWIGQASYEHETGFCPYCMLDTAIGDASGFPIQDQQFLRALNKKFFGGPPFFDQTKDPRPISQPGDWKRTGPDHWVLKRQNEKSHDA